MDLENLDEQMKIKEDMVIEIDAVSKEVLTWLANELGKTESEILMTALHTFNIKYCLEEMNK